MDPYPQVGGSRVPSSINAARAVPDFIVRYRPRGEDPTSKATHHAFSEPLFLSRAEADEFALGLVRRSEADPDSIAIYENTGAHVLVNIQTPPRPGAIR